MGVVWNSRLINQVQESQSLNDSGVHVSWNLRSYPKLNFYQNCSGSICTSRGNSRLSRVHIHIHKSTFDQ